MKSLPLLKTNLIISNREVINAVVSYLLHALMSFLLVGLLLASVYSENANDLLPAGSTFVLFLFLYEYVFIQAKLRGKSLIERSTFTLFPVSRVRSLSIRYALFLVDKRILFYLLPMLSMMVVFVLRHDFIDMILVFFLFASTYLIMSEIMFFLFSLLRKLADIFSVRAVTQFSVIPLGLLFLAAGAVAGGNAESFTIMPVVSQFTKGILAILAFNFPTALMQIEYLFAFSILLWLAAAGSGFLYDRVMFPGMLPVWFRAQRRRDSNRGRSGASDVLAYSRGKPRTTEMATRLQDDLRQPRHVGRHLVTADWLIHQREERILFLLLLYPLMAIFAVIRIASRLHFESSSLIFQIFFFTQILGFYFVENHFTGHGLRFSHIVLTPLEPYKFVFAKTTSTWGLLSFMNVFVCLFCGVYLNMDVYTLMQGTIYSLFLPLVLIQLANTVSLFFPVISRHALISLFIIIISEIIVTTIYVLLIYWNIFLGILLVALSFYLSLAVSIPSWGKQLSQQYHVLLEDQK